MRLVFEDWILSRWWMIAIPLGAVILAAWQTGDPRLWMVVPVLICLVLPLIMVWLYYSYALTTEAVSAVRPHTTRVSADGSITLLPEPESESGRRLPELRIPAGEIASVEVRAKCRIVRLKKKPFRFIFIPNIQTENENI